MTKIVYSPHYDIGLFGVEKLHPFDVHKFSKTAKLLTDRLGNRFLRALISVESPIGLEELAEVHSREYLASLKNSAALARIFEVPAAAYIPALLIDQGVLTPMRWACRGSLLALQAARNDGLAINLGSGFHHASMNRGEGFCVYSDFALIRHALRSLPGPPRTILYVDTDAHQGNGVCHVALRDEHVRIFDIFNSEIYPRHDLVARNRVDHAVPLECFTRSDDYLSRLRNEFPDFLNRFADECCQSGGIAVFNSGTDILSGDEVGLLDVTAEDVIERDAFIVELLRLRGIATVMLLSGGYSADSYKVIAASIENLFTTIHE